MKEDYVSFEISKLLKEKGFNEHCEAYYSDILGFTAPLSRLKDGSDIAYNCYLAPTLQMTCKWLREVHNIHIIIDCDICDSFDFYSIIRIKSEESWKTFVGYEDECSNTYEEAIKKAIKYCLENLI